MPGTSSTSSQLSLSPEQEHAVLAAAGRVLAATVLGQAVELPIPSLGPLVDLPVMGAFVSLKRRGKLRSCCGFLGPQASLLESVVQAAERTAFDDPRFPPIAASELPYLDLEVWLLENSQPVELRGEDRRSAVVVGRHGLHVARGTQRGLLLPGVAVDHHFSAEEFLRHTCLKAGLPDDAWKDDATQLSTFEGHVIRGALADTLAAAAETPAILSHDELRRLADFCQGNLCQIVTGGAPLYFAAGVSEDHVNGAVLSLRSAADGELLHASRLSLRQRLPLQATVFSLTETLAQAVERTTIRPDELSAMHVAVAVLSEPALHGTVAEPDLRGLDSHSRMLLVKQSGKSFAIYDRDRSAAELLAEASRTMRLHAPEHALVVSLKVATLESRVVLSNLPQPTPGPEVRMPAQAGRFYPKRAAELRELVDECLQGPPMGKSHWPAALVPHAGLMYSGRIAGHVLRRLHIPSTVIIIGPKHTRYGMEWAIAPHERWSIPGAMLEADPALARRLSEAIPGLELDAAAHSQEHAIEVELPLIARLAPHARIVGIALGMADWQRCRDFATRLASVIRTLPEPPLLLISSDMNHFASDAENRRLDEIALQAMETLDPQTLLDTVTREHITMCGVVPATIVMETLRQLGQLRRVERAGYATSGDATGDRSRVVGYAGMLLGP